MLDDLLKQIAAHARQNPFRRDYCPTSTPSVGSDYSPNEAEFLKVIDYYKRACNRPFPSWQEVFSILEALGYRKESAVPPLEIGTGWNEVGHHAGLEEVTYMLEVGLGEPSQAAFMLDNYDIIKR
jgi:hypothetical protein